MSSPPHPAGRAWDSLVRVLEWITIMFFAALVFVVLWGVFSRYVIGYQSRWTEELAIYLLVWVSLLGAALMFREKGHLGVDYLVGKFDPAAQRAAAVFVELVVLIFALLVLVYGGWTLVQATLSRGQVTPAMNWKIGYLYSIVPLTGLFVAAFSIEHLLVDRAASKQKGDS